MADKIKENVEMKQFQMKEANEEIESISYHVGF